MMGGKEALPSSSTFHVKGLTRRPFSYSSHWSPSPFPLHNLSKATQCPSVQKDALAGLHDRFLPPTFFGLKFVRGCAFLPFLLLLLLSHVEECRGKGVDEERLIGWQGETYVPRAIPTRGKVDLQAKVAAQSTIEVISWHPRAFLYHNFLTPSECEHLIRLARPEMTKSTVVDSATGGSVPSEVRTSSGMFLRRGHDHVVAAIEKRIADFSFIPQENGEGFQILHYEIGQKYEPHHDFFYDKQNVVNGGQRVATLLMYLTDVEEGGETVFPTAVPLSDAKPAEPKAGEAPLSACAKQGLSVRAKKGDALLFWALSPEANTDHFSLHGSCPVVKGEKWSATKWMHVSHHMTF
eukprot:TRINITY_DN6737_c0_g3_i1.p1 TRINITY_DN6737_c0_g3~~TRINITY_DN6737_c0_g3_i1.p1  ORF type:complete len:351 (+),score=43.01 TRINITY_DN6737_c0_g3_i1:841-1893(+)